ncbi:MAG: hypothetical protein SYC29_08525, partial [Planctomycetota bacterium]|nr:hypothetical protein [Planctomycetota bacterium]
MEWFSSFVLSGRPVGAFLALGLVLAQPVGPAGADTLEVPGQYPTIQAAINAAQTGDEILVAPGVYPERIHLLGKTITLRGTAGPDLTIIDATGLNQDVIICTNGEGPDTIVQGFTVTGGVDGIRTRLSAPTLSDCLFVANAGHGMSCEEAAPVAFDCAFSDNIDCGIQNVIGAPVLERCAIEGNGAGGVFSLGPAIVTLLDCSLIGNTAVFGAGLHNLDGGAARLVNCTFIANQASYSGGGLLNDSDCQVHLVNCLFSDNSAGVDGGAVYNLESDLEVSNGTFSANAAGRDGGAV